ncbi:MAG: hydrolase [Flavobacteriales bacterium TMED96]|nr:MAG: hydrolase [Flavobacteriales bacterium TMED96]
MQAKIKKIKRVFLLFALLFIEFTIGQTANAIFIDSDINVDGIADESEWDKAKFNSEFWQYFPLDSIKAPDQTNFKILYNNENLYVLIVSDFQDNKYVVSSLKRDWSSRNNDSMTLVLDTFNDATNAFLFGISAEGVRREGLISNGGNSSNRGRDFSFSWDVKWEGEVSTNKNILTAELKIPLSSLRYDDKSAKWRINIYKTDIGKNVVSSWAKIPRNLSRASLAFMGNLNFEKPLGKSKTPIFLIPYTSGLTGNNFEDQKGISSFGLGGDAKLSIGSGMVLDLTYNPDFSQVEVDDQIINLTRFEVRLPEKRQFFLQNSDLFSSFGNSYSAQPFFSRRIGVAKDLDGNTIQNKIIVGARLSGKINKNLRLGFLNMITDSDPENEISSNNNSVIALQQKMFSRSFLGLIFINREKLEEDEIENDQAKFNRVLGIDYNLQSKDSKWVGKIWYHKSYESKNVKNNFSNGLWLNYNSRKNNLFLSSRQISDEFNSDLGFIRRTGIKSHFIKYGHRLWIDSKRIRSIELSQQLYFVDTPNLSNLITDRNHETQGVISFTNQSKFELTYNRRYTFLLDDFDPVGGENSIPLPSNNGFFYNDFEMQFSSNYTKNYYFNFQTTIGQFYSGNRVSFNTELSYRIQPKFSGSIKLRYDDIYFPSIYTYGKLFLIGPKLEYTFNKKLFWNTFVQYSSKSDNLGINSRLQWRFAPLSDLYLVYNDNYFTYDNLVPRVRSLTFKLTYWLNI